MLYKSKFSHDLNIQKSLFIIRYIFMRTFSIFFLLLYWSVIILAPVIGKETKLSQLENNILPKIKPNN